MLARVLHALGLVLGDNLLREPSFDNALGYWEHAEIVAAQEALLERIDRVWNGPRGFLPYPSEWWRSQAVAPFRARLKAVLVREMAAAGDSLWGFKDPRTARLLPLWCELFDELGVQPDYLVSLRDPREVAASLTRRDRISPRHAELLWLQHVLEGVQQAGDRLVAVVPYERWFVDAVSLARFLATTLRLPAMTDERTAAALGPLIRPELRHNVAENANYELPVTGELHRMLLAGAPAPPHRAAANAVLAKAQAAVPALIADLAATV
jgi:hypothetical protein